MIGYGMWTGGMVRCSGQTKAGERCKRQVYSTDIYRQAWCSQHKGQKEES